jgi:hypothetical protein
MAPKKSDSGNRPNRVRFVLLEADLSDGNFIELTHAITQALKPQGGTAQKLLPPTQRVIPATSSSADDPAGTLDLDPEDEADVAEPEADSSPKAPRSRAKLPLPKYLHDLDLNGSGNSFKDFVASSSPKSHLKRYLASAYWLKEHGGSPTINADKVYTCYKTASWPLGISDWDANFRNLVKSDQLRRVSPGEYEITPLGEDKLQSAKDQ